MRWTKVLVCVVLSILCATSCQAEEREKRQKENSEVGLPDTNESEDVAAASTAQPEVTGGQQQQKPAAANEAKVSLPVVLPPANRSLADDPATAVPYNFDSVLASPCLLYLEGINIFVWKGVDTPVFRHAVIGNAGFDSTSSNGTYYYAPEYVSCAPVRNTTVGESRFTIAIEPGSPVHNAHDEGDANELFTVDLENSRIQLELVFNSDSLHYWSLTSITSKYGITITPSSGSQIPDKVLELKGDYTISMANNSTDLPAIGSWYQYGYACSQTPAIFTPVPVVDNWFIGFGFVNMQVDLIAYVDADKKLLMFNRDVSDCVGTFSVGSWMGIFCSLVLAAVLMFGYLMLQSVQTMDRFDDPKQKQIVINFKE